MSPSSSLVETVEVAMESETLVGLVAGLPLLVHRGRELWHRLGARFHEKAAPLVLTGMAAEEKAPREAQGTNYSKNLRPAFPPTSSMNQAPSCPKRGRRVSVSWMNSTHSP